MLARLCWVFYVRGQIHWESCRALPRYVQALSKLNIRNFVASILCFNFHVVEGDRPVVVAVDRYIRANRHLWKHLVKRLWVYSRGNRHAKIRPYIYRETACAQNVAVVAEALGSRAREVNGGWWGTHVARRRRLASPR